MATYTTNYQLDQWEPEDPFLRTDFNTDLLKLDEGLTRQAEVSACLGYEALQSRLLTDAAGKPAADGRGSFLTASAPEREQPLAAGAV